MIAEATARDEILAEEAQEPETAGNFQGDVEAAADDDQDAGQPGHDDDTESDQGPDAAAEGAASGDAPADAGGDAGGVQVVARCRRRTRSA